MCIWDVDSGQLRLDIPAHPSKAYNVVFLRKDSVLLSCGMDSALRLWDAESGKNLATIDGHSGAIDAFAVDRDQRYAWAVGADLCALRVDLQTRKLVGPQPRSMRRPTCVAVTPDGGLGVMGELGNQLVACNSQTGETRRIAVSHAVQCVAISASGTLLAAGDRNGDVRLWSIHRSPGVASGYAFDPVVGWSAHEGRVYSLAFSASGDYILSAGSDGKVRKWELQRLIRRDTSQRWKAGNSESAHSFHFLPGTSLLISANPDVGVEFWDCAQPADQPIRSWACKAAQCIGCSRDGSLVAAGTSSGQVQVWDVASGSVIERWDVGQSVSQIEFSPRQDYVAVVAWQPDSAFRQTQLFRLGQQHPMFAVPRRNWRHVVFSPDARQLYVALDEADRVIVWDIDEQSVTRTFNEHDSTITCLAISSDGHYVVSASNDGVVLIHDTQRGRTIRVRSGLHGDIIALLMGPRGVSVLLGDTRGVVRVCNLLSGKRVVDLARIFESGAPEGFAMSGDGRYLAARYRDEFLASDLLPNGVPRQASSVGLNW